MEWPETVSPCIKMLRKEFFPGLSPSPDPTRSPFTPGPGDFYSAWPCGEKRGKEKEKKGEEEKKREQGNRGHGERKEGTLHLLWLPVTLR